MDGGREVTGEVTLIPKPEFREGAAYRLSGEERGGASSRQRTRKGPEAGTIFQCSRNIKEQCDRKGINRGEKYKIKAERQAGG